MTKFQANVLTHLSQCMILLPAASAGDSEHHLNNLKEIKDLIHVY